MKDLFKLGGNLTNKQSNILATIGFILIVLLWEGIVRIGGIPNAIFPSPFRVITAMYELFTNFNLVGNTWYSIKLNFLGYLEAVLISIPLGFMIGLFPMFNGMFSKWVDSIRFIPLTAITGIFIGIFGLALDMKVHFLSFGIIIYLLPIFVTRVNETDTIHRQTMWTLGASKWQTFRYLYFPSVMSKIFSDIRVIVAISWTYIIVAELIAKDLGVGALIATSAKQSRTDMVFAVLIVIVVVGYLSDVGFKMLEKLLFPYNYEDSQVKQPFLHKILKPKEVKS
jgi:NitT/TauT family transport system permease protein